MFIQQAAKAIREAELGGPLTTIDDGVLTGYSGEKLIGALQRLCRLHDGDPTACYLEIGVFQGLTLLSVAHSMPSMPCHGIDNFAFFDPDGANLGIVEARRAALGATNAHLINEDYEDALQDLDRHLEGCRVALLFVDGPHDYRSQLMCLQLALPHLHDQAVIIVDDSNYAHVRQANRDFLVTHPEFRLLFEAYTRCHPQNMPQHEHDNACKGWWNGVNILVRDPDGTLPASYPPTERDRTLFENDHILHASPAAPFLPAASGLVSAIDRLSPIAFLAQAAALKLKMRGTAPARKGMYRAMNTGSEGLPEAIHHHRDQD
ncbi:class I SAM-dependent methyltransferase [Luteimonas soli]|uniref:Class I SAM-dependent methyltransferase n=1 Tax=Luteimonas soli TaxID=1648966 RepID=A0ABV7XGJ9_9GAMM